MLEKSQDDVIYITDEDNVHFESLNPNTIVLNDGWNNLERITAFEAAEAAIAAAASNSIKPADIKETIEAVGDDRKKKQRQKKHDGESSLNNESSPKSSDHEDLLEFDLSNEKLLVADLSNEETSDEETLGEVSSGETKTGLDE